MTAASVLPYTDDVGRSVVNALLQIASWDSLRPHIPILAWNWLKKRPILRPRCLGLIFGTQDAVIRAIVELGDVGLITSYLFVIWSKWNHAYSSRFLATTQLIKEELCGIGAVGCHADLIRRLDYVVSQLDLGWEYIRRRSDWFRESDIPTMKQTYREFKEALVEADEEATKILTGMLGRIVPLLPTDLHVYLQDPTPPLCVHSLSHARSCIYMDRQVHPISEFFQPSVVLYDDQSSCITGRIPRDLPHNDSYHAPQTRRTSALIS